MYYYNTCCVCLEQNKNIKCISLQDTDTVIIEEKLKYILSEFENFDQNITKNICIECLEDVNFVYKFKQKFLRSMTNLSDNYEKQTIKIEPTQLEYNEYQMMPEYNTEFIEINKVKEEQEIEVKKKYTDLHHEILLKDEQLHYFDETKTVLKDPFENDRQNVTTNIVENNEESNHSFGTAPEIFETAQNASFSLLPAKSRAKYEKNYKLFIDWCMAKKFKKHSEKVLLAYFTEKSNIMKSSSLWSVYSMLKSTLSVKNDIDISKFKKLTEFLKEKSIGYRPNKSKPFTREQISKFLSEAPDIDFLMMKVILFLGVAGACRRDELVKLTIDDIEDNNSELIVKVPDMKTKMQRTFIVEELSLLSLYRKYVALRPPNLISRRLFINYKRGKCSTQVVGMNTIGKIPLNIARYLNLPDPNLFTGHCFRRTSASLLANSGAYGSKTLFKFKFNSRRICS